MFVGKWELVVIYETGEKQIFEYESRSRASDAEWQMKQALGFQIKYICVRPQFEKIK